MYHREGKKCDEKERERERERERGGAERAELPRARKEREIIGSCEYLIGDPSISISIPFLKLDSLRSKFLRTINQVYTQFLVGLNNI